MHSSCVVGLATLLAACGSSSKSSSTTTAGGSGGSSVVPARSTAPARRSRRPSTRRRSPASRPRTRRSPSPTTRSGSGAGKSALQTKTVDFAGTDSLPKPEDLSSYQGGTVLNFPTVAAPITVSYNLPDVKKLQLSGTDARQDLRAEDQEVERRRDRGRQPRRDAAVDRDHGGAPLRQLRHDDELHEVPHRRRPDRLDARQRRHHRLDVARHDAGRREELRCRADREVDRRRRRLRRPRRRDRRRAADRLDQEQGRQRSSRRPSTVPRPRSRARRSRPTSRTTRSTHRVRTRTRSPRRRGSSPTRSRRATTRAPCSRSSCSTSTVPGQTLAPTVGYAALPASAVQKAIAQLDKFQIPAVAARGTPRSERDQSGSERGGLRRPPPERSLGRHVVPRRRARRRALGARDPRADRVLHDEAGVADLPRGGFRLRHRHEVGPDAQHVRRAAVHLRAPRCRRRSRSCSRSRSASASRCSPTSSRRAGCASR